MLFSLSKKKRNIRGKGFWKFNSSLTKDQNYINEIKNLIRNFSTKDDCEFSRQLRLEFLKYGIRKLTIHYRKVLAKVRQRKITHLESELKKLEINLDGDKNKGKYNSIKNESDTTILQEAYELEANATSMNPAKNQRQFLFKI